MFFVLCFIASFIKNIFESFYEKVQAMVLQRPCTNFLSGGHNKGATITEYCGGSPGRISALFSSVVVLDPGTRYIIRSCFF